MWSNILATPPKVIREVLELMEKEKKEKEKVGRKQ